MAIEEGESRCLMEALGWRWTTVEGTERATEIDIRNSQQSTVNMDSIRVMNEGSRGAGKEGSFDLGYYSRIWESIAQESC